MDGDGSLRARGGALGMEVSVPLEAVESVPAEPVKERVVPPAAALIVSAKVLQRIVAAGRAGIKGVGGGRDGRRANDEVLGRAVPDRNRNRVGEGLACAGVD